MTSRRHRAALAVWLAAIVIYIAAIAGRTSFGVAGLEAIERFEINAGTLSLFTVVQVGTYALAQIPVGILLDRYGSRKVMTVGAIIMAIGQIGLAFATSVPVALAVRVLIGLGDATAFTAVLRIIPAWFEPRRVPLMTQMTGMVGAMGQVISSIPFAFILSTYGWTPAFVFIAVLAVAASIVGVVFIRDTPRSWKYTNNADDDEGLAKSVSAVVVDPEKPSLVQTLSEPAAWLGFWVHWTANFPATTFLLLWGVPFLQIHNDIPKAEASALLLVSTVAGLVSGPLYGKLVADKPQWRARLVVGTTALTALAFAVVLLFPAPAPAWSIVVLLVVLAMTGSASNVAFDYAREGVHPDRLGTANGLINMGGFIASLIAAAMVGITLDLSSGGAPLGAGDFKVALAAPVVLMAFGVLNFLVLRGITKEIAKHSDTTAPPLREVVAHYQAKWEARRDERRRRREERRQSRGN